MRRTTTVWMTGGLGLIAAGVLGMLRDNLVGSAGAPVIAAAAEILAAAALLLFAIGTSRESSVVARRPLGVIALVVLALWPFATQFIGRLLSPSEPIGDLAWSVFGVASVLVPAAAGFIAAVQIARADTVPSPWNRAPLWVFGLHVVAWVVPQLLFAAVGADDIQGLAGLFLTLGKLAYLAGTLGLGIVAVLLANRRRTTTVPVFQSASTDRD
ncbi:hypothetical protein [Agromyces seonyuensis]|uniref:Uncharacterized protein n=1 Tax=Agromyces seonyuensis TaxID=2662446 RepID=A0A6I4NUQ6_9MICO|nr:hypothetical protein [Agromyces seonyuensis]MWB98186.1 hypothetical protein [Agromyces seonyuensis]